MYKTVILPVVLYEYETWSLRLREEHRLRVSKVQKANNSNRMRVFENRLLWRIFTPKRDKVTGEWRKLHNEELHNLFSSPSIIRMIHQGDELGRICSRNC
jgi:hypothetical protein